MLELFPLDLPFGFGSSRGFFPFFSRTFFVGNWSSTLSAIGSLSATGTENFDPWITVSSCFSALRSIIASIIASNAVCLITSAPSVPPLAVLKTQCTTGPLGALKFSDIVLLLGKGLALSNPVPHRAAIQPDAVDGDEGVDVGEEMPERIDGELLLARPDVELLPSLFRVEKLEEPTSPSIPDGIVRPLDAVIQVGLASRTVRSSSVRSHCATTT